jgi:hypothetical protein
MDQSQKRALAAKKTDDVMYLGRWVPKQGFRTFVYDANGKEKLAVSYPEYEEMIASGLWFAEKPANKPEIQPLRAKKDGSLRSNS